MLYKHHIYYNTNLVLIKYCASPMVSIVPVIVTLRSGAPSSALDILIIAPDTCLKKITKLHYTNSDTYLKLIVLLLWKYVYQGFGNVTSL
jgi:hypothetical protein